MEFLIITGIGFVLGLAVGAVVRERGLTSAAFGGVLNLLISVSVYHELVSSSPRSWVLIYILVFCNATAYLLGYMFLSGGISKRQ